MKVQCGKQPEAELLCWLPAQKGGCRASCPHAHHGAPPREMLVRDSYFLYLTGYIPPFPASMLLPSLIPKLGMNVIPILTPSPHPSTSRGNAPSLSKPFSIWPVPHTTLALNSLAWPKVQ